MLETWHFPLKLKGVGGSSLVPGFAPCLYVSVSIFPQWGVGVAAVCLASILVSMLVCPYALGEGLCWPPLPLLCWACLCGLWLPPGHTSALLAAWPSVDNSWSAAPAVANLAEWPQMERHLTHVQTHVDRAARQIPWRETAGQVGNAFRILATLPDYLPESSVNFCTVP